MTTTTARYAIPKPELTDLVTNGWDAIGDVADAVDTHLGAVADQAATATAAEATARANGDAARIALAVVDALGDLLVGTGPDAVARLPMGTPGQQLRVKADGSGVAWETAPATDLSSRVAKTGDTMSGQLVIGNRSGVVLASGAGFGGSQPLLFPNADGTTLLLRSADWGSYKALDAGPLYDSGSRVYSASNPPPAAGGAVIVQTIRSTVTPQNSNSTPGNTTIPAVNPAKAQLRVTGVFGWGGTPSGMSNVALTSSTNVQVTQTTAVGAAPIAFEITEWS